MIKEKNNDFKDMSIGFGVIFLYLILSALTYDFLRYFGINYNNLNIILKQIYLIIYEVVLTLIIIFIYKKDFIPNFKNFIKNIKMYLKKYIKYWFIILFFMIISNAIITLFTTTDTSENQKIIINQLKTAPIYTFCTTVLLAPIIEELVFRLSFKKIFAHTNFLFILFSGLMFGCMHVVGNLNNLTDFLFIIPYSIPGFIFAYIYSKSKNICVPISLHLIHNLIMICFQMILLVIK